MFLLASFYISISIHQINAIAKITAYRLLLDVFLLRINAFVWSFALMKAHSIFYGYFFPFCFIASRHDVNGSFMQTNESYNVAFNLLQNQRRIHWVCDQKFLIFFYMHMFWSQTNMNMNMNCSWVDFPFNRFDVALKCVLLLLFLDEFFFERIPLYGPILSFRVKRCWII